MFSAYVKELLPEKKKFIVFCHHKVMLNGLSSCLTKQKVDFILIDGTTRNDLRNSYIERFQNNKKCQVAVLSLKGNIRIYQIKNAKTDIFYG